VGRLKFGPLSLDILDTFEAESGIDTHLNLKVVAALMAGTEELLSVGQLLRKLNF